MCLVNLWRMKEPFEIVVLQFALEWRKHKLLETHRFNWKYTNQRQFVVRHAHAHIHTTLENENIDVSMIWD